MKHVASRKVMTVCGLAALLAVAVGIGWFFRHRQSPAAVAPSEDGLPKPIATVALANRTLKASGFPTTFCDRQKASRRSTAAYVVVLSNGVSKVEAIKRVRACGARVIGPLPPNALLVETSVFALGKMSVDGCFAAASEWLPEDKLDARLKPLLEAGPDELDATVVALASDDIGGIAARVAAAGGRQLEGCLNGKSSVTLHLPRKLLAELVKDGDVRWIEPFERPKLLNDVAVGSTTMNVRPIWEGRGLTGTNQVITTSDTGLDTGNLATMHADLKNRVIGFRKATSACYGYDANGHGTHTAGSIVGDGTMSDGQIRGTAYGAKLWAWFCCGSDGYVHTPDACADLFRPDGATNAFVHSASWGSAVAGAYTTQCAAMDEYVWDHPDFLPVFANGNEGSSVRTVSAPASAKNVLAVGATQNARTDGDGYGYWGNGDPTKTAKYSSRGPCADGRIKPDLAAPGTGVASTRAYACSYSYGVLANTNYAYNSGTSMATPLTAGAAALVRQWLAERRGFTNAPPTAALVKAILTGGAKGCLTPDNNQGWGRVDLGESLYPSNRAVRLVDRIPFAEDYEYVCDVSLTNAAPFDAQLVWTDCPATAGAASTLVNDLDLVVSNRTTGAVWYGNGVTGGDHTNTLESVRISTAEPGDYAVCVRSRDITLTSAEGGAAALYLRGAFDGDEEPPALEIVSAEPAASDLTLKVGETNRFAVTVSATAGLDVSYAWTVGGVSVPGATTNRFDWTPAWTNRGSRVVSVTASAEGAVPASRSWIVSVWGEVSVDAATGDDATATGEAGKPFATISAALAQAAANDIVRVGPGTYAGGLVAPAKTLRVESVGGPAATVIDGGGSNRCFNACNSMSTVLSGFTLTNGWLRSDSYYQSECGAGAYGGVLTNCDIVGCTIEAYGFGGGAYGATLTDCRVRDCFAGLAGGGLYYCTATSCTLTDNAADWFTSAYGGGAANSTLEHCTVYGNLAAASGGGVDSDCACTDSIVWGNVLETGEESNWEAYAGSGGTYLTSFSHSCTTPTGYKDQGGNTNAVPRWVDAENGDFRLGTGSPCLGTASDGLNMGAWQGAGVPGHLLTATAVGPGEVTPTSAYVSDGGSATFTATVHHPFFGWTTNGTAVAAVTNVFVWTDVHADGELRATFGATNFFVDAETGNDASNGWSWAAAKRTIQAAVEVAADGETVRVNPGVYTGTVVTTAAEIDIASVGGPEVTKIVGEGGTNRCYSSWLSPSTVLSGFTLADGASPENYGGGVFCGTLSNCVIRNCRAALGGGGAYGATLIHCTVFGNVSGGSGGGVDAFCTCRDSIVWGNALTSGAVDNWGLYYSYGSVTRTSFDHSCTTPAGYTDQGGNANAVPRWLGASSGDFRLMLRSPCLNTASDGTNMGVWQGRGVSGSVLTVR